MSRKYQVKAVPVSWILHEGRRLDCGPYMSGAVEARELLQSLPMRKDPLQSLTKMEYQESSIQAASQEIGLMIQNTVIGFYLAQRFYNQTFRILA